MTNNQPIVNNAGALSAWIDSRPDGTDRDVLAQVLSGAIDLAYLLAPEPGLRPRLERSGLPLHDTTPCQIWTRQGPAPTTGLAWVKDRADWVPAPSPSIDAMLSGRTVRWAEEPECGYLQIGGSSWLRSSPRLDVPQVTGKTMGSDMSGAAVIAIKGVPAVAVPLSQVALMDSLATAGYLPAAMQSGLLLAPLLSATEDRAYDLPFRVTAADVERFGHQSGDMNPLHFDDEFARKLGFSGRIAHGMIFSNWLTRLLGTEYPGNGTIFLRNSNTFFAPVYPDVEYTVHISSPILDRRRGTYRIVAQVKGGDGALAVVSYNDVMRKPDDQ